MMALIAHRLNTTARTCIYVVDKEKEKNKKGKISNEWRKTKTKMNGMRIMKEEEESSNHSNNGQYNALKPREKTIKFKN